MNQEDLPLEVLGMSEHEEESIIQNLLRTVEGEWDKGIKEVFRQYGDDYFRDFVKVIQGRCDPKYSKYYQEDVKNLKKRGGFHFKMITSIVASMDEFFQSYRNHRIDPNMLEQFKQRMDQMIRKNIPLWCKAMFSKEEVEEELKNIPTLKEKLSYMILIYDRVKVKYYKVQRMIRSKKQDQEPYEIVERVDKQRKEGRGEGGREREREMERQTEWERERERKKERERERERQREREKEWEREGERERREDKRSPNKHLQGKVLEGRSPIKYHQEKGYDEKLKVNGRTDYQRHDVDNKHTKVNKASEYEDQSPSEEHRISPIHNPPMHRHGEQARNANKNERSGSNNQQANRGGDMRTQNAPQQNNPYQLNNSPYQISNSSNGNVGISQSGQQIGWQNPRIQPSSPLQGSIGQSSDLSANNRFRTGYTPQYPKW